MFSTEEGKTAEQEREEFKSMWVTWGLEQLKKTNKQKQTKVFLTYHKLNLDVICDIFKAFEAHCNLVLGVVQVAQMQYNDLIAILWGETKRKKQNNTCSITICTTS